MGGAGRHHPKQRGCSHLTKGDALGKAAPAPSKGGDAKGGPWDMAKRARRPKRKAAKKTQQACTGEADAALAGAWGFGVRSAAAPKDQRELNVATLNVDKLTQDTWKAMVCELRNRKIHLCAIQDIGIWTTAGMDQSEFKLWRNACGINSAAE